MSTPAVRLRQRGSILRLQIGAGTYLTDEKGLFRCISAAPADEPGATVLLEDCLTLELVVLPMEQLDDEKLRVVEPAMSAELEPAASLAA